MIGAAPTPGYAPEEPTPVRRVRPGDFAFTPVEPPANDAQGADQCVRIPCTLEAEAAAQAAIAARVESAVLGMLVQALGMATNEVGAAVRHGLHAVVTPSTGLVLTELVHGRIGDLLAFVELACLHGLFDRAGIEAARDRKLAKLCDPANRDHLGRPLAPQPIALGGVALPCTLESWSTSAGTMSLLLKDNSALYGFDVSQSLAERILVSILAAFPALVTGPAAPSRTTLTTSRRENSVATFVFERDGQPVELAFDWEIAREVRTAIDAQFPDAGR